MLKRIKYEDFDEQTKKYINAAIEVYNAIKDFDITKEINRIWAVEQYELRKLDKKVLSLFIAGFLVDGNLKNILEQYDEIKLDDLLFFATINRYEIKKLPDNEYASFYANNFEMDLFSLLEGYNFNVKKVTPEVIVDSLSGGLGKKVLECFFRQFVSKEWGLILSNHLLFKALRNYSLSNGNITEKNNNNDFEDDYYKSMLNYLNLNHLSTAAKEEPEKEDMTVADEQLWKALEEIKGKFIGQENAAEALFYNIVNNQELAKTDGVYDEERAIIFLDGPSGTGKTAITKDITERLDIPFTSTSIVNYSSTGYVGGDVTDTLKDLYKKANGNLEKAQTGIVVLDEFDKLAQRGEGLVMKKAVQQQLLDFLGGGKYTLKVGSSIFGSKEIEFDTSKLTFVCLGALTDLRTSKTKKSQPIGFGNTDSETEQADYSITPQDLISIGFEKEVVARFNTYLHTDDYSREALMKILKNSTISPLISFRRWVEARGKKLVVDEDVYDVITDKAYELNTGARSLQTIMNSIRTVYIKEVLRGTNDTITLDSKTVTNICEQSISRKRRI